MARSNAPSGRPWNPHSLAQATKNQPGKPVSRPYVDNLAEGTQSNPSINAITAIASALGVPPWYFLPSCDPDDLHFVTWTASEEVQHLLRLAMDLSPGRLGELITQAEQHRTLEELPPIERPIAQSNETDPPATTRRWFSRRPEDALSPDEVANQMAKCLLGQPDNEEE
ncbi:MAG: hypothetical protein JWO67_1783 [Streptosporangiaceae bacterium]|nr:hypothetical protein [Streptosporangiaceae bacterium]